MSARTLLVRADASVTAGTGHVMRCLALAQAWQDAGGRAVFAMAETTPAVGDRLRLENVEVIPIEAQAASAMDAEQVKRVARDYLADWIVLDGNRFEVGYQRELKSTGFKLLILDDDGMKDSPADFILNQNSNATDSMYPGRKESARLLLGTRYVMLRREFKAWRDRRRDVAPRVGRLLVTMGGSDPDNVTGLAIRALGMVETEGLRATVVAGGSNPNFESLEKAALIMGDRIEVTETASNMPELMAQADMAVIAGGGTLWELLYMSCPVLTFARNATQGRILADLHRRNVVQCLGDPRNCIPVTLASAIEELAASPETRGRMSTLGREEVDGKGARRVCELMAG
jgi:UDP-2,4-diacetamido-2,4,6-trideoxy-beta-L-altropyranose hydrolase